MMMTMIMMMKILLKILLQTTLKNPAARPGSQAKTTILSRVFEISIYVCIMTKNFINFYKGFSPYQYLLLKRMRMMMMMKILLKNLLQTLLKILRKPF